MKDAQMKKEKKPEKRMSLHEEAALFDYDEALREIHLNPDNAYIKLPSPHIAINLAYMLGHGDYEENFEEGIWGDIDNDVDAQKYTMYWFKDYFKQGILDREKEEADCLAAQQWNLLLTYLILQNLFNKK